VLDTEQVFQGGPFDLIVSNPPYVLKRERAQMRTNVLDWEPALALFVPDDDPLLFYRAVARWAQRFLRPGGVGIVEINEALGDETAGLFRDAGFVKIQKLADFYKKVRFIRFEAADNQPVKS
jgi:release factor glutamine methyltransferase